MEKGYQPSLFMPQLDKNQASELPEGNFHWHNTHPIPALPVLALPILAILKLSVAGIPDQVSYPSLWSLWPPGIHESVSADLVPVGFSRNLAAADNEQLILALRGAILT